jgi:hypothetical protein
MYLLPRPKPPSLIPIPIPISVFIPRPIPRTRRIRGFLPTRKSTEALLEKGLIDNRLGPRFAFRCLDQFGRLGGSVGETFCRCRFFVDGSVGGAGDVCRCLGVGFRFGGGVVFDLVKTFFEAFPIVIQRELGG